MHRHFLEDNTHVQMEISHHIIIFQSAKILNVSQLLACILIHHVYVIIPTGLATSYAYIIVFSAQTSDI